MSTLTKEESERKYNEYVRVRAIAKQELPENGLSTKGNGNDIRAYYFGFVATGVPEIDRILQAVAAAGCGSHHTNEWSDEGYVNGAGSDGVISPAEAIQEYADRAAKSFQQLNVKES